MRFYKDIIAEVEGAGKAHKYRYHQWSPESVKLYYEICTNNPFIRKQFYPLEYWEDLLRWARQRITPPLKVVDVGCGNGNLIESISGIYRDASICGVDLSEESLKPVRDRFKANKNIEFRIGSLDQLPFENASIDLLTCTEVLAHTFPQTFVNSFAEVARILKKGGYYLASVPVEEKINLVCCPECSTIFAPYQVMTFEISQHDISSLLSQNGLKLLELYQSLDRSRPDNPAKKVLKDVVIKYLPGLAKRFFPKAGVSGFLALRSN
jgi:ubiquinone/menaquinone biosynthesis C-methylase UbiE